MWFDPYAIVHDTLVSPTPAVGGRVSQHDLVLAGPLGADVSVDHGGERAYRDEHRDGRDEEGQRILRRDLTPGDG